MGTKTKEKFTPKAEQMALVPERSGNSINGLGEDAIRRPSPIYWHDPDLLAHGEMQKWFYTQNPDDPYINQARLDRQKYLDRVVPDVTGDPVDRSAEDWTDELLNFSKTVDLDLIGITRMKPDWVFEGYEISQKWVVMIGVAHDYEEIKHAPEGRGGAEVVRQYARGTNASKDIAEWFRLQGHDAYPHGGPMAGPMILIPPALECGFGELGKHGSIINRTYGSSFRLACVLTDVPLVPTPSDFLGVDDFCANCQVCSNHCPPDAILHEKQTVRGVEKWYVDFDKCLPFFNEHFGCGACIAACPWSRPGTAPKLTEKLARRRASS